MAGAAIQRRAPLASRGLRDCTAASAKTSRSSTMLVSSTSARAAATPGSGATIGGLRRTALGPRAHCTAHHVEAEQAAFDGAVPQRYAARLLQTHLAGQLEVGREHPGGPAGVVLLPVRRQLAEELATIVGVRGFTPLC